MDVRPIRSALISVFYKDGLEPLLELLARYGVTIYSTGGTQTHLESLGYEVTPVESLTGFPSILDGRVKTLHPAVFGGILARREPDHLAELVDHGLPEIDLVVVDLYPFEETVAKTRDEATIIEKIDIGGISLIRAAAKNFADVAIVPSRAHYANVVDMLERGKGGLTRHQRKSLARAAFSVSAAYDAAIGQYFLYGASGEAGIVHGQAAGGQFRAEAHPARTLRYGENPHQSASFFGDLSRRFVQLHGKELSYNNLVDTDAALGLIAEFEHAAPTAVVIKHTNACGVATRPTLVEAWRAALAGDSVSAFGGVIAFNQEIDLATAQELDKLFFEIVLAPGYQADALEVLKRKRDRMILTVTNFRRDEMQFRSMLGGVLQQGSDLRKVVAADLKCVTDLKPSEAQVADLLFANICAKHLKSNTIALVRDGQLIGMGCGQTSRVDALRQAISKAKGFGFDLQGAAMASDAFFPFSDCIEIAGAEGIAAAIQPGGSKRDQDSVDAANKAGIAMVISGIRHFKH